jgi:TRAP-type C4-dicarboxylate transport system permease small subunit
MRKFLNVIYDGAAYLAALSMIACLLMVLASVAGRLLSFNLRGSDSYAGYAMAAAGFLALAHTLKRGEHIRVTLLIDRLQPKAKHFMEIIAHLVGLFFAGAFAFFSCRLAYQSYLLNDISQGNDATPLWVPQLSMALGAVVLLIAILDELYLHIGNKHVATGFENELKLME